MTLKMLPESRTDLAVVRKRVREKQRDYLSYNFSPRKNDILKTFFDLVQEYDSVADFYRVCVVILHEALQVESKLYLVVSEGSELMLVCDSLHGVYEHPLPAPEYLKPETGVTDAIDSFLIPIYCKETTDPSTGAEWPSLQVIGVLEVSPARGLSDEDKFFLGKYSNRIGYNLRKKILGQENIRHLKFINNLVGDIEHNVIIPNMYFKHLFKQLHKRAQDIIDLKEMIKEKKKRPDLIDLDFCDTIYASISAIHQGLETTFQEIDGHHANYSLFLESLLRRDHFERGCFVLRNKVINVDRDIIQPQVAHYRSRLLSRNIAIEEPDDLRHEALYIQADRGLLSQVYANLFSNAVKYTSTIIDQAGNPRKSLAYGRMILDDHYGPGRPGVKLNVFTTGCHLSAMDAQHVFTDGFQGENHAGRFSSGHGLSFVKYVVAQHGGTVGYEATEQGNNFYFILPLLTAPQ